MHLFSIFLVLSQFLWSTFSFYLFRQLSPRIPSILFSKIQVKLLTDVKGHGKKGDVIQVSPAMWTNVFQPNKQAIKITDEEITKEFKLKAEKEEMIKRNTLSLAEVINGIKGTARISIAKKVNLFFNFLIYYVKITL